MALANRIKLLKNHLSKKLYASHGPVLLSIEVTNRCNLNCIMCSRREMTRPLGDIDWDLFTKVVDQTCHTAELCTLYGRGEPLLHPQFFEMIDYCHQKGISVAVSTNAMLLDREATEKMINHPPDHLILALDASTPETYQKIRRGGDFSRVRDNVEYYLKRKREERPPTFVSLLFVKQELNRAEVGMFRKYWKGKGASMIHIKPVTKMSNSGPKSARPKRCLSPWRSFCVTWQGDVYPCCFDINCSFNLGNIESQPFESIWNGANWQRLRASFKNGQLEPLCRSCTLRQPSTLATGAMSFFPELTVKKYFPYLDRLQHALPLLSSWLWRRD
jgi:radical SAM protein with 4Fe4S-binding SPASM domain